MDGVVVVTLSLVIIGADLAPAAQEWQREECQAEAVERTESEQQEVSRKNGIRRV